MAAPGGALLEAVSEAVWVGGWVGGECENRAAGGGGGGKPTAHLTGQLPPLCSRPFLVPSPRHPPSCLRVVGVELLHSHTLPGALEVARHIGSLARLWPGTLFVCCLLVSACWRVG